MIFYLNIVLLSGTYIGKFTFFISEAGGHPVISEAGYSFVNLYCFGLGNIVYIEYTLYLNFGRLFFMYTVKEIFMKI